jgi:hypothetical protein
MRWVRPFDFRRGSYRADTWVRPYSEIKRKLKDAYVGAVRKGEIKRKLKDAHVGAARKGEIKRKLKDAHRGTSVKVKSNVN